ncbi:MAG: hypothetical protein ACHQQ3_02660 [Gemmatimonadales bacterium]
MHNRLTRNRKGSALILVLIMTLSLAGLAISAIYLSSSAGLLTRYYDKERDYRFAAEQALAIGKSRVNKDTFLGLPDDTAKTILNAASLTDASGATIPNIKVNLYGAYTGDTIGRFGAFVTLLSQAYDVGGTRHVRRLDLTGESFSRYGLFVNSFGALCFGTGEYIRGRAHSNTSWASCAGAPGPDYYDTVSAVVSVTGTANYHGLPNLAPIAAIPYPTVAKLAALPGYATTGNLNFAPVSGTLAALSSGGVNMSGRQDAAVAVRGTRLRFKPVDVANDGAIGEEDGMMMLFDITLGIDTSSLRADLVKAGNQPLTNIVFLNQCGLLATVSGHKEFFPVARFHEPWVLHRLRALATSPAFVWPGDSTTMVQANAAAYNKILSYGPGFSRCFPAGSPYLMLTERYVTAAGACTVTTSTAVTPYGWGAAGAGTGGCTSGTGAGTQQYGGQDTTFTATVTRCMVNQLPASPATGTGVCTGNQVSLGAWRAWPGAALPAIVATGCVIPSGCIQAAEHNYLWPLFKPYNLTSKGVIYSSGRLYMSDTLRGNITLYVAGNLEEIDDIQYDQNPTVLANICRNFLGMIARDSVMIVDNAINRPRPDASGTMDFLGPNINMEIHAVQMSITGTVGVENYAAGPVTAVANLCNGIGTATSGGCINTVGGVIMQALSAVYGGANQGFRTNRSVDPCQLTNRKPPFFPMTGRYLDNKYYEIDPTLVATQPQVFNFFAKLRGRSAP